MWEDPEYGELGIEECEPAELEAEVEVGQLEAERVVLAVGSSYYHDGRVSSERYASDLAPTFLAAIAASHTLLRELFNEMGATDSARIEAHCDQWHLHYGVDVSQAQFTVDAEVPTSGVDTRSPSGRGADADGWIRGLVASRDADHAKALTAFEDEATQAESAGLPRGPPSRTGRRPRRHRRRAAATTPTVWCDWRASHTSRSLKSRRPFLRECSWPIARALGASSRRATCPWPTNACRRP